MRRASEVSFRASTEFLTQKTRMEETRSRASMIRRCIVALGLCVACSHAMPGYRLGYQQDLVRNGFSSPVLEAALGGKPARLLVDTGAGVHTLTRWFANAASLHPTPVSSTARDSVGREVRLQRVETTLAVNGRAAEIALIVVDFPPVFEEHRIAGLLSPQLLAPASAAAVLDLRAGTLRFDSFEAAVRDTGAFELPSAKVCAEGSVKPNRLYAAPVSVGGRTVLIELDSGAAVTTLKSGSLAARALGKGEVQSRTMGVAGQEVVTERATADVAFAGATANIAVQIVPGDPAGCEGDGLLGQDVLAHCVLVLGETRLAAACRAP